MMPKGETLKRVQHGQLDFFRWNITLESVLEKRYAAFRYGEIKTTGAYWIPFTQKSGRVGRCIEAKFDAQFAELTLVKSGKRLYNIEKMVAFENDLRIQRQNIGAGVPTNSRGLRAGRLTRDLKGDFYGKHEHIR